MKKLTMKLLLALAIGACAGSLSVAQKRKTPNATKARPTLKAELVADVQENKPEKYSPPGGGFSVLMPGKPVAEDQEVDTEVGKIINHTHSVEAGGVAYAVMYGEFPAPVSDPEVINGMLDNARTQGIAAVHGELKSEEQITLDGNTGREWLIGIPGGAFLRVRAYWVKQRLYQLITMSVPTKDPEALKSRDAEVQKFLDSFTLVDDVAK